VAAAAVLLTPAAGAAAAATIASPRQARVGERVTVHASGLIPGRYRLLLGVTVSHPPGGEALSCSATIGGRVSSTGTATFSGPIPRRLVCRFGAGTATGTVAVGPGRYRFLVASPVGPGAFSGSRSFVKRGVRIVP
jgi:hypothetical protein